MPDPSVSDSFGAGFVEDLSRGMTYDDLEDEYGLSTGQARRAFENLEDEGFEVMDEVVNDFGKKEFYLVEEPVNHSEPKRASSKTKQSITREANEYLEELEQEVKQYANQTPDVTWDSSPASTHGGEDMIVHETDVHFGDIVKDAHGNVIYDSDIAEEYTQHVKDKALEVKEDREKMGADFDTAHLLLGGDIVTNEAIYSEQPHHIDEAIGEQVKRATAVYDQFIEEFSEEFDNLQVVCQPGNHGEFRVKGSSKQANADDLLYDRLEMLADARGLDNVQFVKTDRSDKTPFQFRDWEGLLTHGQNQLSHIGTSSPQSDWFAIKDEYDFDAAFRGHYHEGKEEPVGDSKVEMTPSRKPGGDFEDKMSTYGEPEIVIYGSDDEKPISWTEFFDLPEVDI